MISSSYFRSAFAVAFGVLAAPVFAVSNGMADTFQGGSTNGWTSGPNNPTPPVNVADGGPLGIGDDYLLLESSGVFGPGGRLVAFYGAQWGGDYINAGVTGIRMDVNNLGATDLHLRLSFFDPVGANTAYSSNAVVVSPGSGWEQILFPIDPAALSGSADAAATLSNVAQVRLYHSPGVGPAPNGPGVAAQLGLDNVTAVPEPQKGFMLAAGLATLIAGKRLRGRR